MAIGQVRSALDQPPPGEQPITPPQVEGSRIGLADAVALTLMRHPDLAQAAAAVARSRADLGAARSVWLPQVSYSANVGPNTFSSSGDSGLNDNVAGPAVTASQLIYDFGRSKGEIGSAFDTEKQRGQEMEAVADDLAETSAVAFLEVKRFEMLAGETARHVAALEHLRSLIKMRVDAGISVKSDLMLADVRLESAKATEIRARSSLTSAKIVLANLIGGMPAQYEDPAPVIESFPEREGEPDFPSLPKVAAAELAAKAASARVGQAKAEKYPSLGLQLGYTRNNYTYNQKDNALVAMVTVKGDLFRPANRYVVDAAEADRRAAQAAKESAELEIRGRALSAQEEILGGYQRIFAYRRKERDAIAARDILFEEYKLGKRTLTELLQTEVEIYSAGSERTGAEFDVMTARVKHENVFGELLPSLGLPENISEDRYDD